MGNAMGDSRWTRIRIIAGAGGEESQAVAALLREMYQKRAVRYDGSWHRDGDDLVVVSRREFGRCEAGVHRVVRIAPSDPEQRRHTSFTSVIVDGNSSDEQLRSYILTPYKSVRDHISRWELSCVDKVLNGYWPFYESDASALGSVL